MHSEYDDIKSRIAEPPAWYDENGCPRYGEFQPWRVADIYADECLLMEVGCQGCDAIFNVALSSSIVSRLHRLGETSADAASAGLEQWGAMSVKAKELAEQSRGFLAMSVRAGIAHYGDPPNHIETDHAGSTMNSLPRRIIQYWRRDFMRGRGEVPLEVVLKEFSPETRGWTRDDSLEGIFVLPHSDQD